MNGSLAKMKIACLDNPGVKFDLLINPDSLKFSRKIKYTTDPVIGTSSNVNRFERHAPSHLNFSFILDGTGVAYDKKESVENTISRLENVIYTYNGKIHEPNALKVSWGNFSFNCRLESLDYEYTLFAPSGEPLRVKISVSFVNYTSRNEEKKTAKSTSPDLSHVIVLKSGESVPFWCHQIYGDASYCTDIARYNGLDSFRNVKPGTRLLFPPLVRNG